MKNLFTLMMILSLAITSSGCGTIYGAAVDERNIKTIASDTAIKTKILKRLIEDETVKALDISVSSYNGHIYLIGEYDQQAQKEKAIEIARSVEGVKNITKYFLEKDRNGPCDTKKNLTLTAKVKGKLIGDKSIWSTNIDVKTMQCDVVLWGLVGSKTEITKAINLAKSVDGVKNVKSFLKAAK